MKLIKICAIPTLAIVAFLAVVVLAFCAAAMLLGLVDAHQFGVIAGWCLMAIGACIFLGIAARELGAVGHPEDDIP